jgi:8-oxo-dGTP pyrophosphatase MutT (NUDIX family)
MKMDSHETLRALPAAIANDLARPLPGEAAQDKMAPRPRFYAEHRSRMVENSKENGVLIALYPRDDEVFLPLILRPIYAGVHSGQVSLPGGRIEDFDSDVTACALREANEEIGVAPENIEVLGQLSPLYIGASNNTVYPVVGWMHETPRFKTDEREVAMLIETPLKALLDPNNKRHEWRELRDRRADVPYFLICNQIVWGATAMILGELLELPSIKRL